MYKKDIGIIIYFEFIIFYALESLEQYYNMHNNYKYFSFYFILFFCCCCSALFMLILINEYNFYENSSKFFLCNNRTKLKIK